MVFIEQGKEQGLDWCLQVVQAVDAGRAMLADTLAQREDEINA